MSVRSVAIHCAFWYGVIAMVATVIGYQWSPLAAFFLGMALTASAVGRWAEGKKQS